MTIKDFKLVTKEIDEDFTFKTYNLKTTLHGHTIEVSFDPEDVDYDLNKFVKGLEGKLAWLQKEQLGVLAQIVSILPEINQTIGKSFSEAELLSNISLSDVVFYGDYSSELYYNSDSISKDSAIIVHVNADNTFENAFFSL